MHPSWSRYPTQVPKTDWFSLEPRRLLYVVPYNKIVNLLPLQATCLVPRLGGISSTGADAFASDREYLQRQYYFQYEPILVQQMWHRLKAQLLPFLDTV